MATKVVKVAISVPVKEFRAIERLRKQLALPRSAVFVQAVQRWLKAMTTKAGPPTWESLGTALASESTLKKDWLRPEEDDAWADL